MSAKSEPPGTGPLSILPTTEGIDAGWGDEDTASGKPYSPEAIGETTVARAAPLTVDGPQGAAEAVTSLSPVEANSERSGQEPSLAPARHSRPESRQPGRAVAKGYVAVAGACVLAAVWAAASVVDPSGTSSSSSTATVTTSVAPAREPVPTPRAESPAAVAALDQTAQSALPTASQLPKAAGETISVHIDIKPHGAKLVSRGEEVGKSPMTIELPRGERRVFEVVLKGYSPRRLVVDGTKEDISFGMKPVQP